MTIATLKLDEKTKLSFGVDITGASGIPEARFIIEGKDFNISYPCKQTNEGVEVEIDGLKNILKAGDYQAKLEVVLENKIYTPLRDTITFEPTVEISTQQKQIKPMVESVKIGKITVAKPSINEDLLRKTQAATIIAQSLKYVPESNETPQQIIRHALEQSESMSKNQLGTLKDMLALAESTGLEIDYALMPAEIEVIVEAKEVKNVEPEDEEESEEELDKMIAHIDDWDDIVDAYEPEELALVDDETGEEINEEVNESEELNEVLSRAERLKARVRFARSAGKRQRKAKIALRKHSSSATINKRARHLAVKTLETKLAKGKPLASLSVAEKERIERIVSKKSVLIGRLAMKLSQRVRTIERNRLAHSTFTKA